MASGLDISANRLRDIKTFPSLVKYLRDDLDWPIDSDDFEDLTFEWEPEELGIDPASAAKIQEIKQLRPLASGQPWGIFFVKFEPRRLPVVALRRVLRSLVLRKRASGNRADRAAWQLHDLLFVSSYGESDHRDITFAHFAEESDLGDLPTLRVLGWDDEDTVSHLEHADRELREKLRWPDDPEDLDAWRSRWSSAFTLRHEEVIRTAKAMAERLAELAGKIRKRVNAVLRIESDKGPLRRLHKSFREALIHDLNEDDFADMYAQTISYGLLTARISRPAGIIGDNLRDMVPVTNPFLRDLLETFLTVGGRKGKLEFDELGVSEVVQMLRDADMEAVLRDFGDRNPQEDPAIHFYVLFLKEYDPEKRVKRGVFYTPRPVVSYIVRSVHELLQTEFELPEGLASTATWAEMAKRHSGREIPKGTAADSPFVQILDPAVGTGTFLVEVIDVVHSTMLAKWGKERRLPLEIPKLWNEYVSKHLLPRLHGYELMMAPYAIAHMKIGLKLYETGYRFASNERARVYLTNSLEPPHDFSDRLAFDAPALAHEASDVNRVKRQQRFTVIVGNPPYSVNSANKHSAIDVQLAAYKSDLGGERNLKPINDDYVKFLRYCQITIEAAATGILGMITNHSYASARLFRAMRQSLLASFSSLHFLDLRGDVSRDPSTKDDQNVFDIQQGVGVSIFAKGWATGQKETGLFYHQLVGSRTYKYDWLFAHDSTDTLWARITPKSPFYEFRNSNDSSFEEYRSFLSITDLFSLGNVGYQTHRDDFVIDMRARVLIERLQAFAAAKGDEPSLDERFGVRTNGDWSVLGAHAALRKEADLGSLVRPTLYRPFDVRQICYAPYLIDRDRRELMHHMFMPNLGLLVSKVFDEHEFTSVFVAKLIVESKVADRTRGAYLFPLFLSETQRSLKATIESHRRYSSNLRPEAVSHFAQRLGVEIRPEEMADGDGFVSGRSLFNWVYAVLHSPGYRLRYLESLKSDFPRVPFTCDLELFRALADLGGGLVALHLMESPKLNRHLTTFAGGARPEVEKVAYSKETVWIDKEQTAGFRGVPEAVWNFHIGGYQVCEKWLKDRKGHKLLKDDIDHYQRIVVALAETIHLMKEIDEVIDKHGGWPLK